MDINKVVELSIFRNKYDQNTIQQIFHRIFRFSKGNNRAKCPIVNSNRSKILIFSKWSLDPCQWQSVNLQNRLVRINQIIRKDGII